MIWPNRILVSAKQDLIGNIKAGPVSPKYRDKFRGVIFENGGPKDYSWAFLQEGGPAESFLELVPKRYLNHFNAGYEVRWFVDPWIVGHWYGYDAHTVVESGE